MNRKLIQEDSGQQCMCESSLEGQEFVPEFVSFSTEPTRALAVQ